MFTKLTKWALFLTLALASCQQQAYADPFGGAGVLSTQLSCPYTPPLDSYSGAYAAFSFRLLKTSYSGGNIVTIKRSSDSTSKTFTASVPTCTINTADAFFDGSTYTITEWYDQSGTGNNVVSSAPTTTEPTVTLSCQNGHPCTNYIAVNTQNLSATLSPSISAVSLFAVANITAQGSSHGIFGNGNGTSGNFLLWSTGNSLCNARRIASSTNFNTTKSCSNNTWYRWGTIMSNTLGRVYLNGVQGTDDNTSITLSSNTTFNIGQGATVYMQGSIAEVIGFSPDLSAAAVLDISANEGAYWGI